LSRRALVIPPFGWGSVGARNHMTDVDVRLRPPVGHHPGTSLEKTLLAKGSCPHDQANRSTCLTHVAETSAVVRAATVSP